MWLTNLLCQIWFSIHACTKQAASGYIYGTKKRLRNSIYFEDASTGFGMSKKMKTFIGSCGNISKKQNK